MQIVRKYIDFRSVLTSKWKLSNCVFRRRSSTFHPAINVPRDFCDGLYATPACQLQWKFPSVGRYSPTTSWTWPHLKNQTALAKRADLRPFLRGDPTCYIRYKLCRLVPRLHVLRLSVCTELFPPPLHHRDSFLSTPCIIPSFFLRHSVGFSNPLGVL